MTNRRIMTPTAHLALIGAGISGLSCGTRLQQAGLEVSLFDKSRSAGGRMSTRRGDDWQCDHGAQYFTARHPDFRAEVARWQQAGVAALWDPGLWLFDGDSSAARESTVERFVGTASHDGACQLSRQHVERASINEHPAAQAPDARLAGLFG
jgi:renalase